MPGIINPVWVFMNYLYMQTRSRRILTMVLQSHTEKMDYVKNVVFKIIKLVRSCGFGGL